jgi:pyruvate,water dikinase
MWVHDLRDADASCGGKAVGLRRLMSAGLSVPDGFVIDDRAFRAIVGELDPNLDTVGHSLEAAARRIAEAEIPAELKRDVRERVKGMSVVAVRSSATIEDGEVGAAAGVFSSRTAVPVAELWDAIRAVWTSALTPLAAAYARRRQGTIAIGVIVQEYIEGEPIVVYTRPPGHPERDEVLVQRAGRLDRFPRELDPQQRMIFFTTIMYALRAEEAIGATRGADVELVHLHLGGEIPVIQTWLVQARPIVHPAPTPLIAPPPIVTAALDDGRTWTWDVAHNPDPLSPAQIGLVERVQAAGLGTYDLRVCAGYLYASARPGVVAPSIATEADVAALGNELVAELERILGDPAPSSLADAIERYLAFYRVWAGELAPLIAAGRAAFPGARRRPSSVEATLLAAARGAIDEREVERRLGAMSPAWDVAVPTFGERPGLVRDAIARAALVANVDTVPSGHAGKSRSSAIDEVAIVDSVPDLAERDDQLFARAQQLVRRALGQRGRELGLSGDDVFWLPLDEVTAATAIDRDDAHRRASAARAAAARAAQWQMPFVVGGLATVSSPALTGVGTGRAVTGRVVRFASLASAIVAGPGDVVVTRAVTPALAVLVAGCAALVSETGGLLDHGAALARELGITCVVGCRDAWLQLADGMIVTVDGDAGSVTLAKS